MNCNDEGVALFQCEMTMITLRGNVEQEHMILFLMSNLRKCDTNAKLSYYNTS